MASKRELRIRNRLSASVDNKVYKHSAALLDDTMAEIEDETEDALRQAEEWEALQAVYEGGDDGIEVEATSESHWVIHLGRARLELILPSDYPSQQAPIVSFSAPHISDQRLNELEEQLREMWAPDTEVTLLWAEYCRAAVMAEESLTLPEEEELAKEDTVEEAQTNNQDNQTGVVTFVPPSSKFGQPLRQFDSSVVFDESHRREIYSGPPFHPPKSGPAETMVAHVAFVTCMEHVNWVLAELLLHNPKVAKASHNMLAYRFIDHTSDNNNEVWVSDNDDDGEKGSGSKLAALLELSGAKNVLVVVSRWYGGVHLGSARFKWIASVARDALEDAGFINNGSSSSGGGGGGAKKK